MTYSYMCVSVRMCMKPSFDFIPLKYLYQNKHIGKLINICYLHP